MTSPRDQAFTEWFAQRYGNATPTATERNAFNAGADWALARTAPDTSRKGSDLRGRVIVYYRPLTDRELAIELGTAPAGDGERLELAEKIKRLHAEKEEALTRQDYEAAASLRQSADEHQIRLHNLTAFEQRRGWACLELDDGTLVLGDPPHTGGYPFAGLKPSNPTGSQRVGFGISSCDVQVPT